MFAFVKTRSKRFDRKVKGKAPAQRCMRSVPCASRARGGSVRHENRASGRVQAVKGRQDRVRFPALYGSACWSQVVAAEQRGRFSHSQCAGQWFMVGTRRSREIVMPAFCGDYAYVWSRRKRTPSRHHPPAYGRVWFNKLQVAPWTD